MVMIIAVAMKMFLQIKKKDAGMVWNCSEGYDNRSTRNYIVDNDCDCGQKIVILKIIFLVTDHNE